MTRPSPIMAAAYLYCGLATLVCFAVFLSAACS
jgi:hypothetical protein